MPRKVCVVTGSRAEYGLLRPLLREITADPALELQLMVTGMHLSPVFGSTVDQIQEDGFSMAARVDMLLSDDSRFAVAKSVGSGVSGMADALEGLKPDIVVVLGDRFEILAAVQAALFGGIPIAHLDGGELTQGAVDDGVRHAITKMAHLHFSAAEPYARRILQMGEEADRVFNVGALAVDNMAALTLLGRHALADDLGIALGRPLFLVTYHPVTLDRDPAAGIADLVAALERFPDATILLTGVNADAGNSRITEAWTAFARRHPERVLLTPSLGQVRYLSAMAQADVVVGNSSSAIIEAPIIGVPTVNVGSRQKGRLRTPSIIDCDPNADAIAAALEKALGADFRTLAARREHPYGPPGVAVRIKDVLATCELERLIVKKFQDIS